MNFLSLLQSLIPSRSASNPSKPARPPLAGAMLEKLEDRVLLSAVSPSMDKSAAKAYREMIMGAAGGAIFMSLESSSSTPAVSIHPYNPRNDGGPINIEARPDEGGFALRRDGDLKEPLTVNWRILGGTADGGDHTLQQSGTATIPVKKQGIRVPVQAVDDDLLEGDETLIVALAPGEGYAVGGPSSATLILGDDDAVPDLSLNGLSEEQEENPGAILAVGAERMALSLNLAGSVRIGSSAVLSITSGADRVKVWSAPTDGELLLDAGQPVKSWQGQNLPSTLWIEAAAPSQSSGDIALTLSFHANPFVAAPATDLVKLTVEPIPVVSIGLISDGSEDADPSYPEDGPKPLRFQISRSANSLYPEDPYPDELKVYLDQSDGTAELGTDYESLPEYILIPAGQGSVILSVKPIVDAFPETDETVTIALQAGQLYELGAPPTTKATGKIAERNGFIDGGNTGSKPIFWVTGDMATGGGHGNQGIGSIQDEKKPIIETGTDANGRSWARVKEGTGLIRIDRSYTGIKAGDQGTGAAGTIYAGKRVYVTEQLSMDLNAHEQGHVDASEKIYNQTIKSAMDATATYRGQLLGGAAGETEAEVQARLKDLINWDARVTAFKDQDQNVNSGDGDFHTWETAQGGGPFDGTNQAGGLIGGVLYDYILRSREETEATYDRPNYDDYNPPTP